MADMVTAVSVKTVNYRSLKVVPVKPSIPLPLPVPPPGPHRVVTSVMLLLFVLISELRF